MSESARRTRRAARIAPPLPPIRYPDLPVSDRRDEIADAIRENQVVIVAGETGSGKTTQLPKICLELGRGHPGQIGHTQPRRIAARAVAQRIADELDTTLGDLVGYQVRFTDRSSADTRVKLMTDGILLAEIPHDRLLRRYDTIIVDEAHERSLNIDFLLGYLKKILPQRPDLKLVVTSATIDTARFAAHFAPPGREAAPVIEVSGRTYPIQIRYRPYGPEAGDDRDQVQAVADAARELLAEGPGDALVFLSGEREIHDTADALTGLGLRDTEVVPLYARLSAAEQQRVFAPHSGRRVVLATNVAETSLTVPGIRYVIDAGTARISRYSTRSKVQRLPIEPISQASADQRAGRCGRVRAGIAVRLYSEDDLAARPAYTEPEILRTNLASVILTMVAAGLGDIASFPFVEPPDTRAIKDGVDLLRELGALQRGAELRLTAVGRRLARLPLDPRLGRMVLAAADNDAVGDALVVAAALSIQDPRERPADQQARADQLHARFRDLTSDFGSLLLLWRYLREQQNTLSGNQFRRLCHSEFLHYLRVREWQDVHSQLRQACRDIDIPVRAVPADPRRLHAALLAGLLSHVGSYDAERRDYLGARGRRFVLHPGSGLARKPPAFVMSAELVETSRLFARTNARIDPLEVERVAGDLVTRTYNEPRWSKRRAAAVATERVTLYGVPLVAGRTVPYARIDPEAARELFLRHALVLGEWDAPHAFRKENERRLAEVEDLEDRVRRRDLLADDEELVAFFDARVPADVVSGRHFDRWWKRVRRESPDLLTYPRDLLVRDGGGNDLDRQFPRVWTFGAPDLPDLPVSYAFEPGATLDGVSVEVPVTLLNRLSQHEFLRQVPGRQEELVTALVRTLPKALRTRFVPVPDTVRAVLPELDSARPLPEALAAALTRHAGTPVPADAFDLGALPDHLRITFRVVDEDGRELGHGRDLERLRAELAPAVRRSLSGVAADLEQLDVADFPTDGVPHEVTTCAGGHDVVGYPALVERGGRVDLVVLPTPAESRAAMTAGVRRLLLRALPSPLKAAVNGLSTAEKLALGHSPYPSVPQLLEDVVAAALDAIVASDGVPYARDAYDATLARAREELRPAVSRGVREVVEVLTAGREVRQRLAELAGKPSARLLRPLLSDVDDQVAQLLAPGFVARAGLARLPDLVRYLRGAAVRLDKAPGDLARDAVRADEVARVKAAVDRARSAHPGPDADALCWQVQELRVSLFAQGIRTAGRVSSTRILRAAAALGDFGR